MAMFSYIYYWSYAASKPEVSVGDVLSLALRLGNAAQLELFQKLGNLLVGEGLLPGEVHTSDLTPAGVELQCVCVVCGPGTELSHPEVQEGVHLIADSLWHSQKVRVFDWMLQYCIVSQMCGTAVCAGSGGPVVCDHDMMCGSLNIQVAERHLSAAEPASEDPPGIAHLLH